MNNSDSIIVNISARSLQDLQNRHRNGLLGMNLRFYIKQNIVDKGYRSVCCKVLGKRKTLITCPDTNKCTACPFGRKPEDRPSNNISWDGLIETGYEVQSDDKELTARLAWMEFEKVKEWMDAKDPNIARAIVLKEMQRYEVAEIAEKLDITERQIYYCLQQAKAIGKKYKERYGCEQN